MAIARDTRPVLLCAALLAVLIAAPVSGRAGAASVQAHANGCAAVHAILGAAKDEFRTLRGAAKHEGLGMWHATVAFPGGRDCVVYAPPSRMYACSLYMGNHASEADAAYRDAVARVRRCVPNGWRVQESVNALRALTKASRRRELPTIFVVSTISDAAAYLVDIWVDLPIR